MEVGKPSRTAFATASARAYHQIAPEPRVFTDPLAVPITGVTAEELAEKAIAATASEPSEEIAFYRVRRLFMASRSRFAEETIADAVADGARQVVILGAGLDTFAYRNPDPTLRVFEVDHPATQAWKRQLLDKAAITVPDSLTFAPIDFESETLATGLASAGFVRDQPAVFIWLGVVMYLTREAIQSTLRYMAEQATPVRLAFDYVPPASDAAPEYRAHLRARADRLAALGEPLISAFTPTELAAELRAAGFDSVEDCSAADLVARYVGQAELGPAPERMHARVARALRT
ncbi:class I SAM-dependent methyltransferase [Nocardia sp. NPDC051052]|uniref:class I SAM-dependent methyltransferase n=1 Tax=Nocardia sp. NPDC051052 TaxID=3364322 RepID=UPI0037917089